MQPGANAPTLRYLLVCIIITLTNLLKQYRIITVEPDVWNTVKNRSSPRCCKNDNDRFFVSLELI